jgi:hypothetical protein
VGINSKPSAPLRGYMNIYTSKAKAKDLKNFHFGYKRMCFAILKLGWVKCKCQTMNYRCIYLYYLQ